jgi:hypothetical protein
MLADSMGYLLAYLALGLLTCWVVRRGWPDEWDETLLASVLGPPLLALVATAVAAGVLRARLQSFARLFLRRPADG